ncbi:MAG: hypothetical protein VW230_07105, partial [Candidatus Poseidoniales archaeon]
EFYAQDEGFDTALNDPSVESIATEDLSGAPVDFTPSVDQQPTSYDEHGFEWYTNDGMHWYRQRDTQAEWTKYQ